MWNITCGGVTWNDATQYRNSITNELFLNSASRLSELVDDQQEKLYYKSWAEKELNWFLSTKLINEVTHIVIDGLPAGSCDNDVEPVGAYWTYNSGVFLDGLVANGQVDLARNVSQSAIKYFTNGNADQILRETSCSPVEGYCDGLDGKMFKGAFVRHLTYALQKWNKVTEKDYLDYKAWIVRQADSILNNASVETDLGNGVKGLLLSQLWQGPQPDAQADNQESVTPWVSQAAAFDALLAAFAVSNDIHFVE